MENRRERVPAAAETGDGPAAEASDSAFESRSSLPAVEPSGAPLADGASSVTLPGPSGQLATDAPRPQPLPVWIASSIAEPAAPTVAPLPPLADDDDPADDGSELLDDGPPVPVAAVAAPATEPVPADGGDGSDAGNVWGSDDAPPETDAGAAPATEPLLLTELERGGPESVPTGPVPDGAAAVPTTSDDDRTLPFTPLDPDPTTSGTGDPLVIATAEDRATTGSLPTGPVPLAATVSTRSSSIRLLLQGVAIIAAAGLVGLAVSVAVRTAFGADDEAAIDGPAPTIAPGPGDPGAVGSDDNSQRGTSGLGQRPAAATGGDDQDAADPAGGSTSEAAESGNDSGADGDAGTAPGGNLTEVSDDTNRGDATGGGADDDADGTETGDDLQPGGPTTSLIGPPTSTGPQPSGPTTSTQLVTTSPTGPTTTGPGTTATTGPSTTATSTPTTPSTTTPTTPTTAPTTTVPPTTLPTTLPGDLIAAPAPGSVHAWEDGVTLVARTVPGAVLYCWDLAGLGGEIRRCRGDATYDHAGYLDNPGPGRIKVRAEAIDDSGDVLVADEMSFRLTASDVIDDPADGDEHDLDDRLRLRATEIPGARRYCWTLTQGSTNAGPFCSDDGRIDLRPGRTLERFEAGRLVIRATAQWRSEVLGRDMITIDLIEP